MMAHDVKTVAHFRDLFSFLLLKILVINYVYRCVCLRTCTGMQVPKEGTGSPGAGVIGGCALPSVVSGS